MNIKLDKHDQTREEFESSDTPANKGLTKISAFTREQATEQLRQCYPAHAHPSCCQACNSARTRLFTWRRNFRIAECHDCGFLWVDPIPSAEDMWNFYNKRSWEPYSADVVQRKFKPELRVVKSEVPAASSILDVGCGHGHFASLLQNAGYKVGGVDIDGNALEYAAKHYGISIWQGELSRLSFDQQFDAVTILSSLEHMVNPLEILIAASRVVRPGGALILSTPRGDGLIPRLSRKVFMRALGSWEFLSPPSHLTYFTRRSITAMLQRAGFASIRFYDRERDAHYKRRELLETMQESPGFPLWVRLFYPMLHYLQPVARWINSGDMMICIARTVGEKGRE